MINIENLTKKFGEINAVEGLTFSVEEGEVFGFLGPNGAGKTTTIRNALLLDFKVCWGSHNRRLSRRQRN
jgi:ABC-2 type transport system ATP-binding protein